MQGPNSNSKEYAARLKNIAWLGQSAGKTSTSLRRYEEPSETTRQSPTQITVG